MPVNFGENFFGVAKLVRDLPFKKNISLADVTFQHVFMLISNSKNSPFIFTNTSLLLGLPEHKNYMFLFDTF